MIVSADDLPRVGRDFGLHELFMWGAHVDIDRLRQVSSRFHQCPSNCLRLSAQRRTAGAVAVLLKRNIDVS